MLFILKTCTVGLIKMSPGNKKTFTIGKGSCFQLANIISRPHGCIRTYRFSQTGQNFLGIFRAGFETRFRCLILRANRATLSLPSVSSSEISSPASINRRLNVMVRSQIPFALGRNGCWLSQGSQLPRAPAIYFFAVLPPERPQKGSTQHL